VLLLSLSALLLLLPIGGTEGSSEATHPAVPAFESAPMGGAAPSADVKSMTIVPAPSGTASGCADAGPLNPYPERTEGYLAFNGNLFDLPVGSVGGSDLCYNSSAKTLSDRTDFTSLPGAVEHGVLGYPEAIVGENIYGGEHGTVDAMLPLPHERVYALMRDDLWVSLRYTVSAPGASPYDFAFDDWFSRLPANVSSLGNVGDRIEVMIWLSNNVGMYLPQTRVAVPSFLNGSVAPGTWYRDQVCQSSDFITFDYLYSRPASTPGYGLPSARIAVNLSAILDNVASVMVKGACWADAGTEIGSLYADNFPLGAEFYPTPLDTSDVDWSVTSMCYVFESGRPTGASLSCAGGDSSAPDSPAGPRAAPTASPSRSAAVIVSSDRNLSARRERAIPVGDDVGDSSLVIAE
jgi:hypothetical protein